jgi:sugar-specific transcriptional regulator TrmB
MNLEEILAQLGFSTQAGKIYRYVLTQKQVSARQIAHAVGISRPSVYDHLKTLIKSGLVVERDIEHKKYFSSDDPKKVLQLLEEQKLRITEGKTAFQAMLPTLTKNQGSADPKVKFYPGKEGFRQVLTEVLLEEPKELLALWPFADMTEVAGEEYLRSFTTKRVRDGITVRAVWPFEKNPKKISIPAEETRFAPKGTDWQMGSLIYGDKVSFISSAGESFCFTVTSQEFAELSRAQFELVWRLSRPL